MRYLLITTLLMAGCIDYNLEGQDDDVAPGDDDDDVVEDDDETVDDDSAEPEQCPDPYLDPGTVPVDQDCEAIEVGTFTPVIEWHDGSLGNIYTAPVVAHLTDDDGDGVYGSAGDVPDIIAVNTAGDLYVLSGDGSGVHWSQMGGLSSVTPAIGDLDGDGDPDFVVVAGNHYVAVQGNDGTVLWTSTHSQNASMMVCGSLALADLDADGQPEVIAGDLILSGVDGSVRGDGAHGIGTAIESPVAAQSVTADIDGDGVQEVVVGNALYDVDGNTIWFNGERDGYVAVGNFDADPWGEIVVASYGGEVRLQDDDGTVLWRMTLPTQRIGPPTVEDLDDDGEPEIGVAGSALYAAIDTDGSLMWQNATTDASSGCTGSSVFDFEGDGAAEIVYADENDVWIFDGATGTVKLVEPQHSNLTCTEYPPVVDVDNDGQAEIVYASYSYSENYAGITVLGDLDESWMPTRSIWNQHAYSITNVDDDGTIPANPATNWATYNNFRSADLVTAGGSGLPDAVPDLVETCPLECDQGHLRIVVRVGSAGLTNLPVGTDVALYAVSNLGDFTLLETRTTASSVSSGATTSGMQFDLDPADVPDNRLAFVVDDDGTGVGSVDECHEDNNQLLISDGLCQ